MKAAWDWHLPRETPAEQRELVEFVADCGFDTLIVRDPTESMTDRATDLGLDVVAIVYPYPDETFQERHPDALQRMRPVEHDVTEALAAAPAGYQSSSFRWFPIVQGRETVCFDHPDAQTLLQERVTDALSVADGVAFDGFGYQNHYACFCTRCRERRSSADDDGTDSSAEGRTDAENGIDVESGADADNRNDADALSTLANDAEDRLVDISALLYDHAKSVDSEAIVTNHLWPPFRPNPTYGRRLHLDYCTQTISWFYRPTWSLDRVAFEAETHRELEDPNRNLFVPFVGVNPDPSLVRSPERIADELELALTYGDGRLVFCTLGPARDDEAIRSVIRDALA